MQRRRLGTYGSVTAVATSINRNLIILSRTTSTTWLRSDRLLHPVAYRPRGPTNAPPSFKTKLILHHDSRRCCAAHAEFDGIWSMIEVNVMLHLS